MISCEHLSKSYHANGGRKVVLDDLNFDIRRGDRIGLLGRNGAGKSTLIKLIGGVEFPTSGRVRRKMSCSWPLGFSGGFQGSLTGYDNARFISRIYGRPFQEIRDYIEDFTELGRYLSMPVKTYSSGMRARLAFALSLVIEFECYLIDEIISVGDQNFQEKCRREFFERRSDRALIIASHSIEIIREYCNLVLVLNRSKGVIHSDINVGIEEYAAL